MAIKVGGIYTGGRLRADNAACHLLRELNGPTDFDDYVVDLCFTTYTANGIGHQYAAGLGIRPGMVGRKQRRFIVDIEVPPGLPDANAYAVWMTSALAEVGRIVRTYLPTKSKEYPAERLAAEVEALRLIWQQRHAE